MRMYQVEEWLSAKDMDGEEGPEPINTLLKRYADKNMTYENISSIMEKNHGCTLSANAIRKRLKRSGYPCRRGPTLHSREQVKESIKTILEGVPNTVGYRQMTDHLRQANVHVRRDMVMELMRDIDPSSVNLRRRRRIQRRRYTSAGPNHTWHVDGYDKLKPFGFAIHGCIDGFSRRILWLNVGPSNNDPAIVARYFVSFVDRVKGCPLILQSDPGTENGVMGALQSVFRQEGFDPYSDSCYRVTRSVFNQRIEAWWSTMRIQQSQWWIDFFNDLELFGGFHKGNEFELRCIRYCFMPVLQDDLSTLIERWNDHFISRSRQAVCPNGRPSVLYSLPENYGYKDCIQQVDQDCIDFAFTNCRSPTRSGSEEFDAHARNIFFSKGWTDAVSSDDALQKYFSLLDIND